MLCLRVPAAKILLHHLENLFIDIREAVKCPAAPTSLLHTIQINSAAPATRFECSLNVCFAHDIMSSYFYDSASVVLF